MGTINSRNKGAAYERELAQVLREAGFSDAQRGQQHKGGADSPDVIGLPGYHIEAKRVENLSLYTAMDQAVRDCGPNRTPVVVHRRNGRRSVAILHLDDFLALVKKGLAAPPSFD